MRNKREDIGPSVLTRWIATLFGSPWFEIMIEAWKLGHKIIRGLTDEGMYEVKEYESTLELQDKTGKKAVLRKRKKVRYLQNNIIAYQDYGWGDGDYFLDYRARPGIPVDRYKLGYKTYILLSLREVKNRGDIDEFHIQWKIKNGFLKADGFWETDVSSQTKYMKLNVIFPKDRPPQKLKLVENNIRRTRTLDDDAKQSLPDGRWKVTWETSSPHLYEHYILKWDW